MATRICSNLVAEYQYNLYSFGEEKNLGLECTSLKYNAILFFSVSGSYIFIIPLCVYIFLVYVPNTRYSHWRNQLLVSDVGKAVAAFHFLHFIFTPK